MQSYDVVIVGSGMGGGMMAFALKDTGLNVLLIERGDFLPQEAENWSPAAVFDEKRYKAKEIWYDGTGKPFAPGVHYFVGGNTKVYGAALPRLRQEDFGEIAHEEGISPAWPITYAEMEPYYLRAEQILRVHGEAGQDPTEAPRSDSFPYPPVAHEPYIEELKNRLKNDGFFPFYLPLGIDLRESGRCIRCKTCDGFPCQVDAKSEADLCCVRPALETGTIKLLTRTYVRRLIPDVSGKRINRAEIESDGEINQVVAGTFIISCGAVNSAALLLRSTTDSSPNGLSNSSGLVGRNYMAHNNTALMAVAPLRINRTVFQKTMAVNDFYLHGDEGSNFPLGNLQLLGKLQAGMLTADKPFIPRRALQGLTDRSVDWWVMSEDLPDPNNRVIASSEKKITVRWKANNLIAHNKLIAAARRMLQRVGYPVVLVQRMGIETNSHQCGTAKFGSDPKTSVLNQYSQSHDIDNLYVVDSSFFPSSSACNPALTIAAQALRAAEHVQENLS